MTGLLSIADAIIQLVTGAAITPRFDPAWYKVSPSELLGYIGKETAPTAALAQPPEGWGTAELVPSRTAYFGPPSITGRSRVHKGIDIRAAIGQPVYAVADGILTVKPPQYDPKTKKGWGKYVELFIPSRQLVVRYAHLSKIAGTTGTPVRPGTIIGWTGQSGTSSPHLHVEFLKRRPDGKLTHLDPLKEPGDLWKYTTVKRRSI
jgi:murein DD-endopeptidase MepM/ murein hydrolase activator NlpD